MMTSRLGLMVPLSESLTRQESLDLVGRAEDLGYHSAWYGESWGYDAFTTLAQVATLTSRIKIGTLIATVFSRTPAMMAQSAASLDAVSEGRLILGLGTSGPIVVRNWHGQDWKMPVRRLREYIEILRLVLSGEPVDYVGELFSLKGFRLRATPLRRDIEIMIAALGARSIEQAGEIADGWLPIFPGVDLLKRGNRLLSNGANSSHRDSATLEIAPSFLTGVSNDERYVRELGRGHLAFYIGGMGSFYADLVSSQGFGEEVDRIRAAWTRPNRTGRVDAARAVTDQMLDSLTLLGTRDQVLERLAEYEDAGVTLPIMMFPFGSNHSLIEGTIEALGPKHS